MWRDAKRRPADARLNVRRFKHLRGGACRLDRKPYTEHVRGAFSGSRCAQSQRLGPVRDLVRDNAQARGDPLRRPFQDLIKGGDRHWHELEIAALADVESAYTRLVTLLV